MAEPERRASIAMENDDRIWVARAARGDRSALERLLRRIDGRVLDLAHRLTGDADVAKDLRQQALIRVCRGLVDFAGRADFETWVHRIVVNLCRDHLRSQSAMRRRTERHGFLVGASAAPSTHDETERMELGQRVATAVGALPDEEREALVLHHYQGLSFPEIARVLEVPETTLKSRFARALERLATRLATIRAPG